MKKAYLLFLLIGRLNTCGRGTETPDAGRPDAGLSADAASDAAHHGDAAAEAGRDASPVDRGRDASVVDASRDALPVDSGRDATRVDSGEDAARDTGSSPTCGNGMIDPGETCDPPDDITCDPSCQTIPIVCGNGVVQPGEVCEFGDTQPELCQNCQLTSCGECFVNVGAGLPPNSAAKLCAGLDVADSVACNRLVACVAGAIGRCTMGMFGALGCFCSNPTCSAGLNGPCATAYEAVTHSTDPNTIIPQILNSSTRVGEISAAATRFAAACGSVCATMQ